MQGSEVGLFNFEVGLVSGLVRHAVLKFGALLFRFYWISGFVIATTVYCLTVIFEDFIDFR